MDSLNRYDQAAVDLWQRGHIEVVRAWGRAPLAEAGIHAVLCGLRSCQDAQALFRRYGAAVLPDLILIASLLGRDAALQSARDLRDAAFHLRWLELGGTDAETCST